MFDWLADWPNSLLFIIADILRAIFICNFLIRFTGAKGRWWHYVLLWAISMLLGEALNRFALNNLIIDIINILVFAFFTGFILRRPLVPAFTAALVVVTLSSVIGHLSFALLSILQQFFSIAVMFVLNYAIVYGLLFLLWWAFRFLSHNFPAGKSSVHILTLWLPLIMILVFSELFASFYTSNVAYIGDDGKVYMDTQVTVTGYEVLATFLFSLASIFVLFFSYKKLSGYYETEEQRRVLAQQVQWQKNALREAASRYDKTRTYRHDLKTHLGVLHGLIAKGSYGEAEAYLSTLDSEAATLAYPVHTGSAVLDVLLSEKLTAAQQEQIKIECDAVLPPTGIDEYDLCTLLGNALDNAINACMGTPPQRRFLSLSLRKEKDFLYLHLGNAKGKEGQHGTGLGQKSIRLIVEKYHGSLQVHDGAQSYELTVLLAIPQQKEGDPQPNG